jgi:hypothetical protein
VLQLRQIAVLVLGIPRLGAALDDDLDGLSLVLVQHAVNSARRSRSDTGTVTRPASGDQQRQHAEHAEKGDDPDEGNDHCRIGVRRC